MRETTGTTAVPYWTGTNVYDPPYPRVTVVNNGTYLGQAASHGSRFASVPGLVGNRPQEIVGTLSSPTNVGTAYVLSAQMVRFGFPNNPTVELRLRNSGTGAQSAPLVHAPSGVLLSWSLLTGTVTANANYDRVVLRYLEVPNGGVGTWGYNDWMGLADDVRVCKMAVALHERPAGWWTLARVVGVSVLAVVLMGGLALAVRRFRTRGRYAAATVRG